MKKLLSYPWKGNIRELKNVLERAMILCTADIITPDHLILNPYQKNSLDTLPMDDLIPMMMGDGLEALENRCITYAMEKASTNVSQAARILGISRATLRYRLEKMEKQSAS